MKVDSVAEVMDVSLRCTTEWLSALNRKRNISSEIRLQFSREK